MTGADTPHNAPTPHVSTEPHPARILIAVAVIVLAGSVISLDLTLVYPAILVLAKTFHTASVSLSITIISVVGAAVCPLAGKLGDRFGKKQLFLWVVASSVVGSLLCALTSSYTLFVIGRALQGAGASIIVLAFAYIRDVVPKRFTGVGLGAVGIGIGIAAIAGPFLSAWLLAVGGYRALFWFLACYMGILGLLFGLAAPGSTFRQQRSLDLPGALMLGVGFGLPVLGLAEGGQWGWASILTVGSFVVGAVLVGLFVVRTYTVAEPLVDLRYLTSPSLFMTAIYAFCFTGAIAGIAFVLPQMIETRSQPGIHYGLSATALQYGVMLLPYGVTILLFGPVGGMISRTYGPRLVARISATMLVVTSVLLTIWHAQAWEIYVIYGITGIGFGLFYAAYPILIAEAVPGEEMGTASGIVNVINSLGSGICPTVVGLILAEALLRTDSVTGAPVYTDGGYVGAWIFLTVVGVGALLVSLLMRHGGLPLGVEPEAASEIAKGTAVPR